MRPIFHPGHGPEAPRGMGLTADAFLALLGVCPQTGFAQASFRLCRFSVVFGSRSSICQSGEFGGQWSNWDVTPGHLASGFTVYAAPRFVRTAISFIL